MGPMTIRNGIRTMTVAEAATLLGVDRRTIHARVRRGSIRKVAHEKTAGRGRLLLSAEDVERVAAERKGKK